MATLSPQATVGQLVVERASRAKVFEHFGIDYCCGGKMTIAAACSHKGLDPVAVIASTEALDAALAATSVERDWLTAPLDELVDYILDTHHAYLREALPRLSHLVGKVARVHSDTHPELNKVAAVYAKFYADMDAHMAKEEGILFPLIKLLAAGQGAGFGPPVHAPIAVMEAEHDDAGRDLEAINALTNGFSVPPEACNSYRAMLNGLRELELETHRHIHLEHNVLFLRAQALGADSVAG